MMPWDCAACALVNRCSLSAHQDNIIHDLMASHVSNVILTAVAREFEWLNKKG